MPPLLVRLALGLLFLVAGVDKFLGPGPSGVMTKMAEEFQKTLLPGFLVRMFAYLLPFLEVALGFFLILGLYRRAALLVSGGLLLMLAFGMMLQHQYVTVASNLFYVFLTAWAIERSEFDTVNLDQYLK